MARVSIEAIEEQGAPIGPAEIERRRSQRAELIVRVDYATVDEIFSEFTRDINEGGLFIETDKPPAVGTEVSMQFALPGGHEAVTTVGRVVRVSESDDSSPSGMGIEFENLSDEARTRINEIVRGLRAGRAPAQSP
jgi:type IV pilus assembly protein PilZ